MEKKYGVTREGSYRGTYRQEMKRAAPMVSTGGYRDPTRDPAALKVSRKNLRLCNNKTYKMG
jgi:hypothetical protein